MSALAGRRVVVTRARHQAGRFVKALEARGACPILFPTIAIHAVEDQRAIDATLGRLAEFDWVVFTSANAVVELWRCIQAGGIPRLPAGLRVAAVGPGTAAALARVGVEVNTQPGTHTGAAIAATMGALTGAQVLLPQGDIAREETSLRLQGRGARVTEVIVYRTVTETPDAAALAQLRAGAHAITFTSPSTVRGFSAIVGDEAHTLAASSVLVTIGPTTSAAVRDEGWGEPLEARTATSDSLLEALERSCESQRSVPDVSA